MTPEAYAFLTSSAVLFVLVFVGTIVHRRTLDELEALKRKLAEAIPAPEPHTPPQTPPKPPIVATVGLTSQNTVELTINNGHSSTHLSGDPEFMRPIGTKLMAMSDMLILARTAEKDKAAPTPDTEKL